MRTRATARIIIRRKVTTISPSAQDTATAQSLPRNRHKPLAATQYRDNTNRRNAPF